MALLALLLAGLAPMASSEEVGMLDSDVTRWQGWVTNEGWQQQTLATTGQPVFGVCRLNQISNNNWLLSPLVRRGRALSVSVEVTFTMRECAQYPNPTELRHCEDTLGLFFRASGEGEAPPANWTPSAFRKESVLAPDHKWLDSTDKAHYRNVRTLSIQVSTFGFFIALRDTGSCTALYRIRIFHKECPGRLKNFATFPRTPAQHLYDVTDVRGRCVPGAEALPGKEPLAFCKADGSWHEAGRGGCHCSPGMRASAVNLCEACPAGFFKATLGSTPCLACPANSSKHSTGAASCSCLQGFFRAEKDPPGAACTRPPSAPRNLRLLKNLNGLVLLAWDLPEDLGGRSDLTFHLRCEFCPNAAKFSPQGIFKEQNVTISGLSPGQSYRVKVFSSNGVSSKAGPKRAASAGLQLLTLPPKSSKVLNLRLAAVSSNSANISWERPPSLQKVAALQFQVRICASGPPEQCELFFTTKDAFAANLQPDTLYIVRVRVKMERGWGEDSDTLKVRTSVVASKFSDQWSASQILSVVLPCLIAMAIFIFLLIMCVLQVRRDAKPIDDDSVTPYSNIVFPVRPAGAGKFYVDPQTYEDLTDAVRDFAQEIDASWITIACVIGGGEFGDVCRGSLRIPGRPCEQVAIKTLKPDANEKARSDFLLEASIMGQFRHRNVIRLLGVVTKSQPVMILTEFMERGSLEKFLKTNPPSRSGQVSLLRDVASGMAYLSNMHFVHRDLAARNVLVAKDGTAKVSDFGLSRVLETDSDDGAYVTRGGKIPVRWTAPEAINFRKYTTASDVWSFGIVMWEVMAGGERPYWDWTNHEVIHSVNGGFRLPQPFGCPADIFGMMLECWEEDRLRRPSFAALLARLERRLLCCSRERPPPKPPTPTLPLLCPTTELEVWLGALGLGYYAYAFRCHGIFFLGNGLHLSQAQLAQLGVAELGHQELIMASLEMVRAAVAKEASSDGCFV